MIFTQQNLDDAERHVLEGDRHIAKQTALVERHIKRGLSVAEAQSLLAVLCETQITHVNHRDLIQRHLGR